MIKRIIRIFVISTAVCLVTGLGSLGYILFNIVGPSLSNAGLSYSDLFTTHLDQDKYNKLQESINARGSELGKQSAKSVINGLNKLFPAKDFDYSKVPAQPYTGPSVDDVLKESQQKAQEGINQGLNNLDQSINKNESIKQQTTTK